MCNPFLFLIFYFFYSFSLFFITYFSLFFLSLFSSSFLLVYVSLIFFPSCYLSHLSSFLLFPSYQPTALYPAPVPPCTVWSPLALPPAGAWSTTRSDMFPPRSSRPTGSSNACEYPEPRNKGCLRNGKCYFFALSFWGNTFHVRIKLILFMQIDRQCYSASLLSLDRAMRSAILVAWHAYVDKVLEN